MKINNRTSAIVFGIGMVLAASAAKASAQDLALKSIANPENTNQEARTQAAPIHEETADISFDNTGVVNCDGSLEDIDKNALPNF